MHKVNGERNREAVAFVASGLSFGSRKQFLPKIARIVELSGGDVDGWIRSGRFKDSFPADSAKPFYRFFSEGTMNEFFGVYRKILNECGSLGECLENGGVRDAHAAVGKIVALFSKCAGEYSVVPKNPRSACKRVCMFLRWMVRDDSCVDLGLWSRFISKETLIVPLDTHVLSQAKKLGLVKSKVASMSAAQKLTEKMKMVFPTDPLKADFALFGNGVNGQ
ncbi:MAG: TIGR02757 family protein [Kiritimatiellae bacterium]|nr:TIGR02757 family protein [Kiritimatiellia bacterium]